MARFLGSPSATCSSDHFASINPDGIPGLHRIHEALDLASGEGNCVFAAYAGTIVDKSSAQLAITHHDNDAAFATQYIHIVPGPKNVGDRVLTGERLRQADRVRPARPNIRPLQNTPSGRCPTLGRMRVTHGLSPGRPRRS